MEAARERASERVAPTSHVVPSEPFDEPDRLEPLDGGLAEPGLG